MTRGIYIYQDVVSNGVSDVFSAENDRTVKRNFAFLGSRCPADQAYAFHDTNVYKIGVLHIDDESGQLVIEPIAPVLVCRGTDFSIGSVPSVKEDKDFEKVSADLS